MDPLISGGHRWLDMSPSALTDDEDFSDPFDAGFGLFDKPVDTKHFDSYEETEKPTVDDSSTAHMAATLETQIDPTFGRKIPKIEAEEIMSPFNDNTSDVSGESREVFSYSSNSSQSSGSCRPGVQHKVYHQDFTSNVTNGCGSSDCEAQKMDIYRDLILRHLIQDISTTCARLRLPTDAKNWTPEHTARWISDTCKQFNIPLPSNQCISGHELLRMTLRDFELIAPVGGDTLHAQLQLWKTAFESYHHHEQCGASNSMTAADNGISKWSSEISSPTMSISSNHMMHDIKPNTQDYVNYSGQQHMNDGRAMGYYGGNHQYGHPFSMQNSMTAPPQQQQPARQQAQQPHQAFFSNCAVMPSPTDSESSGDEMGDDECLEMGMSSMHPAGYSMNGTAPVDKSEFQPYSRQTGTIHLWHFIRECLDAPKMYGGCVRWVDREEGTFKIESSQNLARFWGRRKNRSQMNYDKLSRSLRQYYKKGIIQKPEKKQRLVYKFLPPYHL